MNVEVHVHARVVLLTEIHVDVYGQKVSHSNNANNLVAISTALL
jgi:hypothetical protein